MMRSLFSGVAGLNSQQLKMDVIGNNISNVNTVGFKASRINFNEAFNQVLANARQSLVGGTINPLQVGLGVRPGSVDRQFTQGTLQTTGLQTDLGLQGQGFFVVGDQQQQFYTRAGNFHFDAQGRLVTPTGFFVKGWMADDSGKISQSTNVENIVLDPNAIAPAVATSNVKLAGNLDASAVRIQEVWTSSRAFTLAADGQPAAETTALNDLAQTTTPLGDGDTIIISGTNPDGSPVSATFTYGAGNDGTTVGDLLNVINSAFTGATATLENGKLVVKDNQLGDSELSISLAAGQANAGVIGLPGFLTTAEGLTPVASASTLVYDSLGTAHTLLVTFTKAENPREWQFEVSLPDGGTITAGGKGTLSFGPDGTLQAVTYDGAQSVLSFDPNNGANPVSLTLDFGDNAALEGLTLFDGASSVSIPSQDGQAQGILSSFLIDEQGRLFGTFTNGTNRLIGQIALAQFNNPSGLVDLGNNLFRVSEASGTARIGKSGEDFDTAIFSGALEASNVDLAQEFTEMIIAQRAFQANARTITVADQFLSEAVQLKR